MAIPGVLMRLVEARDPAKTQPAASTIAPKTPCPNVEAIQVCKANDGESPSRNTVYFLSDITPILSSSSPYDEDVQAHASELSAISWIICAFINGRDGEGSGIAAATSNSDHLLPSAPAVGSVLVCNGSTPRPDKEQDYHDWYDQEHGHKLTLVPGWNSARRYKFEKLYGNAETASFYGFNYYSAENGLGGPEWKAGVTEWTMRIRSNAAKPNIRRVWKLESTTSSK